MPVCKQSHADDTHAGEPSISSSVDEFDKLSPHAVAVSDNEQADEKFNDGVRGLNFIYCKFIANVMHVQALTANDTADGPACNDGLIVAAACVASEFVEFECDPAWSAKANVKQFM